MLQLLPRDLRGELGAEVGEVDHVAHAALEPGVDLVRVRVRVRVRVIRVAVEAVVRLVQPSALLVRYRGDAGEI